MVMDNAILIVLFGMVVMLLAINRQLKHIAEILKRIYLRR